METATLTQEQETLLIPVKQTYDKDVAPAMVWARGLVIQSDDESLLTQERIKQIKQRIAELTPAFDEPVKAAHLAHKKAKELYNLVVGQLEDAVKLAGRAVASYVDKKEREAKAEADRLEAERREKERKEQEKLTKRADKAEEKGQTEKAENLRQQAETVFIPPTPVSVPAAPAKVAGASFKTVWKGEVLDIKALCQSVIDGKCPPTFITPNLYAINSHAKSVRDTMPIPGIRFFSEKQSAFSTR